MNNKKLKLGILAVIILSVIKIMHYLILDPIIGREAFVNSTFHQVVIALAPGMNLTPLLNILSILPNKTVDIFFLSIFVYGLIRYFRSSEDKIGKVISITTLSIVFAQSILIVISVCRKRV